MTFWQTVAAVLVGNLLWSCITLPISVVVGILIGIMKAANSK